MAVKIHAVGRASLAPFSMPEAFRTQVAYFMSVPGASGVPPLKANEYWIDPDNVRTWLEEGVFRVVSPLDSATQTEVELSEEQESWLQWMQDNGVSHIRLG